MGANIITELYQPYEFFLFLYTFFLVFTAHKLLFLWAYLKKSISTRHSHHFCFQYLSIICYMPTTLITCILKFPMIHSFSIYAHQVNKMISHLTLNQQKMPYVSKHTAFRLFFTAFRCSQIHLWQHLPDIQLLQIQSSVDFLQCGTDRYGHSLQ